MFAEARCLLAFGNWPLNQAEFSRGKWEGQYYTGVHRESVNLHLKQVSVILSTVTLERQAGLNSATTCEFKATLESFSKLGGGGCRIEAGSE